MLNDWLTLRSGGLLLELAPSVGGSIARFSFGDQHLLRPAAETANDAGEMASFPLVPFSNRIRGGRFLCDNREVVLSPNLPGDPSPLHGQGWRASWQVDRASETSATLSFVHEPGEWPWRYESREVFMLHENGLSITLSCRNLSPERMPCALAFHPYFPCDGATRIDTDVTDVWLIDEDVLPTTCVPATGNYVPSNGSVCGRGLDHGYEGWSGSAIVDWGKGPRLKMTAPCTRFQLYAPETGGLFVAEPVENANCALNRSQDLWEEAGIHMLEQGAARALEMRFEIVNVEIVT